MALQVGLEPTTLRLTVAALGTAIGCDQPSYIQHSAHIPPGRDGLFGLVRAMPKSLHYENHLILAERDHVMLHGRFTGHSSPRPWLAADRLRLEDDLLTEH